MISLKPESPEELRKRLREMSNLELRRFGERPRKYRTNRALCDSSFWPDTATTTDCMKAGPDSLSCSSRTTSTDPTDTACQQIAKLGFWRPLKLRISGQTLDRANSFPRLHFADQNRSWELIWAFGAIDSKALSVGPHCS